MSDPVPYTQKEMDSIRLFATQNPSCSVWFKDECLRWLATVDALRAEVAALKAVGYRRGVEDAARVCDGMYFGLANGNVVAREAARAAYTATAAKIRALLAAVEGEGANGEPLAGIRAGGSMPGSRPGGPIAAPSSTPASESAEVERDGNGDDDKEEQ